MNFLKVFLLIFILISQANANTIYNLIKIPNLEIYNNKSSNDVKYLKATKPFQVGIRNNNVTCFNSSKETINENFSIIKNNFNKYNSVFLKKVNLKYVVLCENLSVSEIDAGGIPNHKMKTLIINIKFNKDHLGRIVHHEIFHLVNKSYKKIFLKKEWEKFNSSKFEYAKCSTCSDRLDLNLLDKTEGFLTEYSMSTASEDMAEIFSFLMIDKEKIENKALKDPILSKKISYIKKGLLQIDKNFKF